ncbi:UPF0182 family protein [Sporichthya polymorpha]|uniref:UPF0182 family membrane protein n=1 Tax=Sporichthya polymorpha TaxID=35751 RepID=UPI0003643215|nr:UPF0182 family protein [Sporichthya polymorpha]
MTFNPPDAGSSGRRPFSTGRKRPKALIPTLVILVMLLFGFGVFTSFMTDLLWFRSIQYTDVFTTRLTTRIGLFLVFGLLMAVLVVANIVIAYRLRPAFRGMSAEQQNLDRYRVSIDPYRVWLVVGVGAVLGILGGTSAAGEWRTWLQWRHGTSFGVKDPQFNKDVSFYVFDYPWWRFILGFFFAIVLVSLLATAVTHYLYGGLRLQTPGEKSTPAAQAHISVLLGLFVLLKAVAYWLDRYGLAVHGGGFERVTGWTGLRYRDVNALLPAKTILVGIALICAVLFFANVWRRTWILPGLGLGLLVLSAVLIGGVYPAIVQQFQVRPSEVTREAPYIDRNIQATRTAYGIADAEVTEYDAKTTAEAGALRANANTTASIRLLDPNIVSPTFQQQQQIRGFYSFPDTLKIDRYNVNGRTEDVVAAVRELNLGDIPPEQRNWVSDHLIFTHGYGFVAARGNTVNSDGGPNYLSGGISATNELVGEYEPRIYFGEESPEYSIVGRSDGANREFDYPDDTKPNGQSNNTYAGKGGVPIGSFWKQMLYAVKFREQKILLSSDVDTASKILYIRDPRARIGKVAPWLTLDGNPYPAIIDGRVQWIVDGYTTSGNYPYASRTTLGTATETTLTTADRRVIAPRDEVNYIRNSVKATVDAYDGTVSLYTWDEEDPVLKTWKKAFPDSVKEKSEIPDALMSHLRYPEDLFKVQREMMARYHVTDAETFYGRADFWQVPRDPGTGDSQTALGVASDTEAQPPYYLTLQMPGQKEPAFSLSTAFEPAGRQQLSAFMAVNATPGAEYGKIRVLQLPRNTTVPGPRQVQNEIKADPGVNAELLALRVGNKVTFGNLLTLPVGGGLLYVEPLYVQAATGTSFPLLQQVIVAFGDNIAIGRSLGDALDKVFEGDSGVTTPDETPSGGGNNNGSSGGGQNVNAQIASAIADAQKAYSDGQEALAKGDFAAYGKAQDRLEAALNKAANLQNRRGGGGGGGNNAPVATPTRPAPPDPTPAPPNPTPPADT